MTIQQLPNFNALTFQGDPSIYIKCGCHGKDLGYTTVATFKDGILVTYIKFSQKIVTDLGPARLIADSSGQSIEALADNVNALLQEQVQAMPGAKVVR